MTILNSNYRLTTDEHGLAVIEVTGRCTASEAASIEGSCTRRYKMVPIPHASGAVLKSFDGTTPRIVSVTPTTVGRTYRCVKVDGRVTPFAHTQSGGTYTGKAILAYRMVYQEVGETA